VADLDVAANDDNIRSLAAEQGAETVHLAPFSYAKSLETGEPLDIHKACTAIRAVSQLCPICAGRENCNDFVTIRG
jgi:hypothetical protein